MTMNAIQAASALYGALITKTRDSGKEFYCLKSGSPEWMTDVMRACHDDGEILPNDWRYRFANVAAGIISELDGEDEDALREGMQTRLSEDSSFPYYHELTDWLSDLPAYRMETVDEVRSESGDSSGSLSDMLQAGMVRELDEVANAMLSALLESFPMEEDEEEESA